MGEHFSRWAFLSLVGAIGLTIGVQLWSESSQPAFGNQLGLPSAASNGLFTHVLQNEGRATRVIIVDPQTRAMGVYDVQQDTGEIQLKSIRSLKADLQMLEFNTGGVSPEEIQKALNRQK